MRVSRDEGVASHVGPESCVGDRKVGGEALTGERAGRVLSLENVILRGADLIPLKNPSPAGLMRKVDCIL